MSDEHLMYRAPVWINTRYMPKNVEPARMFMVGRSMPREVLRLAVAWLYKNYWYTDVECSTPLNFEPTYFGEPPRYPPWPPGLDLEKL